MNRVRLPAAISPCIAMLAMLAAGATMAQDNPSSAVKEADSRSQLEPAASQADSNQADSRPATASPAPSTDENSVPAGGDKKRKATKDSAKKSATMDRLELDTTAITGNRELPKVLYIVPWKKADLGDLGARPAGSLLDEVLAPVDRDVFRRQTAYFDELSKPNKPNTEH